MAPFATHPAASCLGRCPRSKRVESLLALAVFREPPAPLHRATMPALCQSCARGTCVSLPRKAGVTPPEQRGSQRCGSEASKRERQPASCAARPVQAPFAVRRWGEVFPLGTLGGLQAHAEELLSATLGGVGSPLPSVLGNCASFLVCSIALPFATLTSRGLGTARGGGGGMERRLLCPRVVRGPLEVPFLAAGMVVNKRLICSVGSGGFNFLCASERPGLIYLWI